MKRSKLTWFGIVWFRMERGKRGGAWLNYADLIWSVLAQTAEDALKRCGSIIPEHVRQQCRAVPLADWKGA